MKRYVPFLIIAMVAAITIACATMLFRAKRRELAANAVDPKPATAANIKPSHSVGPTNAPVTLEEFGDFQCPACAATSEVIRAVEKDYAKQLRGVFWQFPLPMHAHGREAALAAEAASRQGRFWEMHDLLYRSQATWKNLTDAQRAYEELAEEHKLDLNRFRLDAASPAVAATVDAEHMYGEERGVKNTPTLFVNGQEFPPPFTAERLHTAIDSALNEKTP